jgi:oxygen-independent coproporphyrinogen-3 oxidase
MGGLYFHIPFCKQACYYCDFHFSTDQSYRADLIKCLLKELMIRKDYLGGEQTETIYFGGGTPSLLSEKELDLIFNTLYKNYNVYENAEITLEANPDDLSAEKLKILKQSGINRLSIGIQSFDDAVLKSLNRAHTGEEALRCIAAARETGINNLSIDLIHSIPGQDESMLRKNLDRLLALAPEHISAYSLTVEENTVFGRWAAKGKLSAPDEDTSAHQFEIVMNTLIDHGYRHYEISNFCKPGFHSKHNTSYWQQKKYLGIGPSAHSYDGDTRQYNVANNHLYMKAILEGHIPAEIESLSQFDKINEYIFTSLRTDEGCDLSALKKNFGFDLLKANETYLRSLMTERKIALTNEVIVLTKEGKLLADKIASDLFVLAG